MPQLSVSAAPLHTRRLLPSEQPQVARDFGLVLGSLKAKSPLRPGSHGPAVVALQRLLRAVGLWEGGYSGTFDAQTEAAVKRLQALAKAPQTGALDRAAVRKLFTSFKRVNPGFKGSTASVGQVGADVLAAERRLRALGFDVGKVDGVYDQRTAAAVAQLRKATKAGGAGMNGALYADLKSSVRRLSMAPERKRIVKWSDADKRADQRLAQKLAAGGRLKEGDQGAHVKHAELHLRAAGYGFVGADGRFDGRTAAALKAFQKASGLPGTGELDARTWAKLRGARFFAKSGTSAPQTRGERSVHVRRTEKLLKSLGYEVGRVDGKFDAKLEAAVRQFQRRERIRVSGKVGTGTASAIERKVKAAIRYAAAVHRAKVLKYLAALGGGGNGRIVDIARQYLGVRETGNNGNPFSAYFGRPPEPWCADFVSYVYTKAGRPLNIASTSVLLERLRGNGTLNRSSPRVGDIVIFDWSSGDSDLAEHTGIVESVFTRNGQTWVRTIEGNSGNMVQRREYPVSSGSIRGFGRV